MDTPKLKIRELKKLNNLQKLQMNYFAGIS